MLTFRCSKARRRSRDEAKGLKSGRVTETQGAGPEPQRGNTAKAETEQTRPRQAKTQAGDADGEQRLEEARFGCKCQQ